MSNENLYKKVNKIYKEIETVIKDAEVNITKSSSYTAVSHDAVTALLHKPFADAGIVLNVDMKRCEVSHFSVTKEYNGQKTMSENYMAIVDVHCSLINSEDTKDKMEGSMSAYALDTGDKAVGKACSMAVKNWLLKNFMLESQDEEEARPTEQGTSYNQKSTPTFSQQYKSQPAVGAAPKVAPAAPKNHAPQAEDFISEKQVGLLGFKTKDKDMTEVKGVIKRYTGQELFTHIPKNTFNTVLSAVEKLESGIPF